MLYWSTQRCLQLYSRKYPHSKAKVRITLSVFSLRQCLSRVSDNCDKTKEKWPDVLSLFKKWRKFTVRNLKRVCVWGEGSSSQPLSHLPFIASTLRDLSVRRATLVLLIDLTPTDRRLTLDGSGQTGPGTPATQQNYNFPKCSEGLWEHGSGYWGRLGTPESKTKLLSVKRSWKQQFGRKTLRWNFLHEASRRTLDGVTGVNGACQGLVCF